MTQTSLSTTNFAHGISGEQIASTFLTARGWTIIDERARNKRGEIDLIARRRSTLIFAEVKTTRNPQPHHAQVLNQPMQQRIRRAAIAWMTMNPRLHQDVTRYRFDALFISLDILGGSPRVEHIENAF